MSFLTLFPQKESVIKFVGVDLHKKTISLRVIAESKNKSGKVDAQVLAEFLLLDMLPGAWRPSPRARRHRVLVRHRCWLNGRITACKTKRLSISKEGSRIMRWALIQAVGRSDRWKHVYDSLKRNTGSQKKAIVGAARRLLCVMFAMLREGKNHQLTAPR